MTRRVARPARAGFTLTEILLVLAILGVIAAMVVPNLIGQQQKANILATRTSIGGFAGIVDQYAIANGGTYPEGSQQEVVAMLMNPGQDADGRQIAKYLQKTPKDAWDQPLYYEYPNGKVPDATGPAIWSAGPNKQNEDGNGDDINNWKDIGK
jgi:general secretion pathway protein G